MMFEILNAYQSFNTKGIFLVIKHVLIIQPTLIGVFICHGLIKFTNVSLDFV